jgi:BCD family chlorophyll transporter-like MFS transporter
MLAAVAIAVAGTNTELGIALAVLGYAGIGAGVSACGTSILTLLAKGVAPARRGAAATAVWMMMIAGFAVTAGVVGGLLEPYSPARLVAVTAGVGVIAMVITLLAMRRLESDDGVASNAAGGVSLADTRAFRRALAEVWAERDARRFTAFVFVSMLAYSAQDLILEPFAGAIFGWTPGATTQLAGMQHGGVLVGMLLVAITTAAFAGRRVASLRGWVAAGCFGSAVMMFGLVCAALSRDPTWPLAANVFALGVANGAFSIAAIASMMTLATTGTSGREGTRMGLWGAAQAIAFGVGGFLGTILVDLARSLELGPPAFAYALVFALESIGFAVALRLALASTLPESPRPIRHTVARRHVALSGDFPEPTTP